MQLGLVSNVFTFETVFSILRGDCIFKEKIIDGINKLRQEGMKNDQESIDVGCKG